MANRNNKKVDDDRLIALNNLGLSLTTIAELCDVHHTTVSNRLKLLGIQPIDTRRTFIEDVWRQLPAQQQQWLVNQLGPTRTIKDFVRDLMVKEYVRATA